MLDLYLTVADNRRPHDGPCLDHRELPLIRHHLPG